MKSKINTLASLIATALALTACGGGGGSSGSTTANSTQSSASVSASAISGTAAAGAPIAGTVTLLDSRGTRKTTTIKTDGSFTIDTAGLQGPFLLRATGSAAGTPVTLHAAATSDDLGRTINITPLTDLIVANIAGTPAASLFDAALTDLSAITTGALDRSRDTLTVRLRPILDGMGVVAGFDLLRSPFKADHSGLDGALDLLKVSVDQDRGLATITSRASGHSIVDHLGSLSDTDALPPVDGSALRAAVSDLNAISAVLEQFNTALRNGPPSGSRLQALTALFDSDFLDSGLPLAVVLSSEYLLGSELSDMSYTNPVIVSRSTDGNTIRIRCRLTVPGTFVDDHAATLTFRKNAGGRWLIQGNRQIGGIAPNIVSVREMQPNGTYTYQRYVEFWIDSPAKLGASRAVLQGPGLPSISTGIPGLETVEGIVLRRTSFMYTPEMFAPADEPDYASEVHLPICADQPASRTRCLDESRLQAHSVYTVTFLDSNNRIIGEPASTSLAAPPLSAAQMAATPEKWFASFTSLNPATRAELQTASNISASWTLPTSAGFAASYLDIFGDGMFEETDLAPGATSWSLGRGIGLTAAVRDAQISVTVKASGGREFTTVRHYP